MKLKGFGEKEQHRNQLKKLGMLDEYTHWRNNITKGTILSSSYDLSFLEKKGLIKLRKEIDEGWCMAREEFNILTEVLEGLSEKGFIELGMSPNIGIQIIKVKDYDTRLK